MARQSFFAEKALKAKQENGDEMTPIVPKEGFTFGADPELFVFDRDGNPVPPDMVPGNKAEPHKVENGAVQRDGMAAEFNIDPASDFKTFNRNIESVMKQLEGFLPKGYSLRAESHVVFEPSVFAAASDEAKELGCTPDFDAWTGEISPPPGDPDNPFMRCAGGHLHLGWTEGETIDNLQHVEACRDIVKQFDWYLGGWSIGIDKDPVRRRLYGKAGACRFKPYGVEYRVLSNFWVTTRERRLAVWNRANLAINAMASSFIPDRAGNGVNQRLIQSINSSVRDSGLEHSFRYPLRSIERHTGIY